MEKYMKGFTQAQRPAFLNAVDCIYFGYGQDVWNTCGCEASDYVWDKAHRYLAESY